MSIFLFHKGIGGGIQIPERQLQALLPFPARPPERPGELARKLLFPFLLAFSIDGTKLLVKSMCPSQRRNPCSGPLSVYQDMSMHHDWPVKKPLFSWLISLKQNSKRTSGNSPSSFGALNKGLDAALQTLITWVRFCLRRRLLLSLP